MSNKIKNRFERSFPIPVEKLFDFWTDVNLVKLWLSSDVEIDPEKFYKLAYDFEKNFKYRVLARIMKFTYPDLLVFQWLMRKKVSKVKVEFAPLSPATSKLKITHVLPEGHPEILAGHPGDWDFYLLNLEKIITKGGH